MKKVLLILCAVAMFSFTSIESVSLNEDPGLCGSTGSFYMTSCGSKCLTIYDQTPNGRVARKPTETERSNYRDLRESQCNSLFPESTSLQE